MPSIVLKARVGVWLLRVVEDCEVFTVKLVQQLVMERQRFFTASADRLVHVEAILVGDRIRELTKLDKVTCHKAFLVAEGLDFNSID